MSWTRFIASRKFFKHLIAALVVTVVLATIVLLSLSRYTRHGKAMAMPDLQGLSMEEIQVWEDDGQLEFVVTDSVFNDELQGGTVYMQDPFAGSMIKRGRKAYLTLVARSTEKVTLPNLTDFTLRQAIAMLETYRLQVDSLEFVPDIGKTVIDVRLGDSVLQAGDLIPKGTGLTLVIGRGQSNERVAIPFLIGKTRKEALKILSREYLNAGAEFFPEDTDSTDLVVNRQKPAYLRKGKIQMGTAFDLWYTEAAGFDIDRAMQQLGLDSLEADSLLRMDTLSLDTSLQKF